MTLLFIVFVVSFLVVVGMVLSKSPLILERKKDGAGSVGFGVVTMPMRRWYGTLKNVGAEKTREHVLPVAQGLLYRVGTFLHELFMRLAQKLALFSERVKGRGVVERDVEPAAFLDSLFTQRTQNPIKARVGR